MNESEINWKYLSFSLIFSTILNGSIGLILLLGYVNTLSHQLHTTLSDYTILWEEYLTIISKGSVNNSSVFASKTPSTVAFSASMLPFGSWIVLFCVSYVFVTLIAYILLNYQFKQKNRKKPWR